ncbi:hypothetical protein GCM10022223_50900 [Kineosporia mesophila]|uniref:Uncharacterized protein n=1 Tax=Kineosporia mesophila TaxID=566012 RepID=A0ABP7A9J4_9ACTN|nr:DUF6518 family protein [Kineosporia mesophila]MCD5355154.1 DUF6518 family protein [Kineosporia mesophila]
MFSTTDERGVPVVRDISGRAGAVSGVVASSFVLGAVTSFAQGFLPGVISSLANSASGWTIITVLLLLGFRAAPLPSALLGAASFVLLTLGYTLASALRGHPYDPTLFCLVGVVVGPFVGLAAAWLRERDLRAALATAVLAGIAVGEAVYGLTVVADSTSPFYWTLIGLTGLGLAAWMVTRRLQTSLDITLALGLTAVVAAGFLISYQNLGTVL